jgi:hypothetical protein
MGRAVTVTDPGPDEDGSFPKAPASVCLEEPPRRQCYTMPKDLGRKATVELVAVRKDLPALLFSAASGGTSGWRIQFALLRPGKGKDLLDLFGSEMVLSNQSQHTFWNDPAISESPIFLTAEFVWGPGESHYEPHRYMVSAYVFKNVELLDDPVYCLEDSYMTVRKYDLEAGGDVLSSERQEILSRLVRAKLAADKR